MIVCFFVSLLCVHAYYSNILFCGAKIMFFRDLSKLFSLFSTNKLRKGLR
jgi:hypothetical protein